MTINIAIAVSEGLIMAADSLSQMTGSKDSDITVHQSVEKITELRGKPIAVMISGIGELNKRTIISLIREFEFDFAKRGSLQAASVTSFASVLMDFMRPLYEAVYPPHQGPTPRTIDGTSELLAGVDTEPARTQEELVLVVGGYSPGKFFPEIIEIAFPGPSYRIVIPRPNYPEGSVFIDTWGHTTAIDRILHGYDAKALHKSLRIFEAFEKMRTEEPVKFAELPKDLQSLPVPPPTLLRDLDQFGTSMKMRHRLRGMPLQEAVEFADFLGNVAIGYDRFYEGTPCVGGELDVLAMQPDGVHWYKRKQFLRDMASARDAARQHAELESFRVKFEAVQDLFPAQQAAGTKASEAHQDHGNSA